MKTKYQTPELEIIPLSCPAALMFAGISVPPPSPVRRHEVTEGSV